MPKTVSSTELQKKTRAVIDWARMNDDAVIVETYNKPMAVVISYQEYQSYLHYKEIVSRAQARKNETNVSHSGSQRSSETS